MASEAQTDVDEDDLFLVGDEESSDKEGKYLGTLHVMYDISEGAELKNDDDAAAGA